MKDKNKLKCMDCKYFCNTNIEGYDLCIYDKNIEKHPNGFLGPCDNFVLRPDNDKIDLIDVIMLILILLVMMFGLSICSGVFR